MRRPASVSEPKKSRQWLRLEQMGQAFINFALLLACLKIVVLKYRNTGAVVATILEPPEAFENDGRCRLLAYIANDATHKFLSGVAAGRVMAISIPKGSRAPSLLHPSCLYRLPLALLKRCKV